MIQAELDTAVDQELLDGIYNAAELFADPDCPVEPTQLLYDEELSNRYDADVILASELHQPIGVHKIRGGWNFMSSLTPAEQAAGVVTPSAGNHAQAVALSANLLGVKAVVFMPENAPEQKVNRVAELGGSLVDIVLSGKTYDETEMAAKQYQLQTGAVLAPPFNHREVIAGQGTLGAEIINQVPETDFVISPVGGGGTIAGIATAVKGQRPETKVVGVEPTGAASLQYALSQNKAVALQHKLDTLVDGAAVQKVGELPFAIAQKLVEKVVTVQNDILCTAVVDLWERDEPIKAELAGALSVAGLEELREEIAGKTVVCLVTGGNLSQSRYTQEIKPLSLVAA